MTLCSAAAATTRWTGGGGLDLIDGGSGTDTAVYSGSVFDYTIYQLGPLTGVIHNGPPRAVVDDDRRGGAGSGVIERRPRIDRRVGAGAAVDQVEAAAAGQRSLPLPPNKASLPLPPEILSSLLSPNISSLPDRRHHVVAGAAGQLVVLVAAVHRVVAAAAEEDVVAGAAQDEVVTVVAENLVVAVVAINVSLPLPPDISSLPLPPDMVSSLSSPDMSSWPRRPTHVVAGAARHLVIVGAAVPSCRTRAARQLVIAGFAV